MTPGSVVLYGGKKYIFVSNDGYRSRIVRRNHDLRGLEEHLAGNGDLQLVAEPHVWSVGDVVQLATGKRGTVTEDTGGATVSVRLSFHHPVDDSAGVVSEGICPGYAGGGQGYGSVDATPWPPITGEL